MNKISKPGLVDLLRIADHGHWFFPRIRYASIRSKPALIEDLRRHFCDLEKGETIVFRPKTARHSRVPGIVYDLKSRKFLFDGEMIDVPRLSREKPVFSIRLGKVTVSIPWTWSVPVTPLSTTTVFAFFERSRTQHTRFHRGFASQSRRFCCYSKPPTWVFYGRLA